jgi:hypothetical protein
VGGNRAASVKAPATAIRPLDALGEHQLDQVDFLVTARRGKIRVIEALPDQLITRTLLVEPKEERAASWPIRSATF